MAPLQLEKPLAQQSIGTFDFLDASLESFIEVVAAVTGKRFILDPRVRGLVILD